jgi:rRNA maturation protein Nop10
MSTESESAPSPLCPVCGKLATIHVPAMIENVTGPEDRTEKYRSEGRLLSGCDQHPPHSRLIDLRSGGVLSLRVG